MEKEQTELQRVDSGFSLCSRCSREIVNKANITETRECFLRTGKQFEKDVEKYYFEEMHDKNDAEIKGRSEDESLEGDINDELVVLKDILESIDRLQKLLHEKKNKLGKKSESVFARLRSNLALPGGDRDSGISDGSRASTASRSSNRISDIIPEIQKPVQETEAPRLEDV